MIAGIGENTRQVASVGENFADDYEKENTKLPTKQR